MAIILNDNIDNRSPKPIATSMQVADLTARDNLDVNYRWAGMITYVESEKTWYYLDADSTDNLSDNLLWSELTSGGGGIELTDLSVTTNSPGNAALSYDNTTGVFTYTPPDLSGYAQDGDYIPLAGTDAGSPVTGDIELDDTVTGNIDILGTGNAIISFIDDGTLEINNTPQASNVYVRGIDISGLDAADKGIDGSFYYGANYADNTYVQKKYVDDNFLPLPTEGTDGQVLTTDGAGAYTWEDASGGGDQTFQEVVDTIGQTLIGTNVTLGTGGSPANYYGAQFGSSPTDPKFAWSEEENSFYIDGNIYHDGSNFVKGTLYIIDPSDNFITGDLGEIKFDSNFEVLSFDASIVRSESQFEVGQPNDQGTFLIYSPSGKHVISDHSSVVLGDYDIQLPNSDIDFSGGSIGDVLTLTANGLELQTPSSGGLQDLASVLAEGNSTGSNDITFVAGQKINFDSGNYVFMEFDGGAETPQFEYFGENLFINDFPQVLFNDGLGNQKAGFEDIRSSLVTLRLGGNTSSEGIESEGRIIIHKSGLSVSITNPSSPSGNHSVTLPDGSGSLILDAPSDGNDYVRNNGAWVVASAGGGGDDWGAQVVESDATLSGDGTAGSPLGVVFTDLPTDYGVTLATVATSGDYNDLSNLPVIPSAYTDEQAQDAVGSILLDSEFIDLTYIDSTPYITATIIAGSLTENELNASVNASLDLADSALQSGDNVSLLTNDAGYITGYTETDPVFSASPAANILASDITNWDTAYNNHIVGINVTGTTTKTITLTQQDGGELTADFTDLASGGSNTYAVVSGWISVEADGTVNGSNGLSCSKGSAGVYNYTFDTPQPNNDYAVSGVMTMGSGWTDTNISVISKSTTGFTVQIGQGDNSNTSDVLINQPHDLIVMGETLGGFVEVNDLTDAVVWANVPDANITESSVVQHEAAITITESQISDLGDYIELIDLSVNVNTASGGGNLSYNNATGQFDYTPPDLSGYLTSTPTWGETLVEGNTTNGTNAVISNGDVIDFTNAGLTTDLITFPSSARLEHLAGGALNWYLTELNLIDTAGNVLAEFQAGGVFALGGNSGGFNGILKLRDTSSTFEYGIEAPNLTTNRNIILDDSDVDFTAGASEDDFVLTYNHSTRLWSAEAIPSGGVSDHGALTGLLDDDHTQYHTDARALTWLGTRTTDDLPEGVSNLYFPGFTSLSADYGFTDNSSDWDTAFGWGDHAAQGYLTSADIDTLAELNTIANADLFNDAPSDGNIYGRRNAVWVDLSASFADSFLNLNDVDEVDYAGHARDLVIVDGGGSNHLNFISGEDYLSGLSVFNLGDIDAPLNYTANYVLLADGAGAFRSAPIAISTLQDGDNVVKDVNGQTPTAGSVTLETQDIAEGAGPQYHTTQRANEAVWQSGTVFPTTPFDYQHFFRTDLGTLFYWDASRSKWLTVETISFTASGLSNTFDEGINLQWSNGNVSRGIPDDKTFILIGVTAEWLGTNPGAQSTPANLTIRVIENVVTSLNNIDLSYTNKLFGLNDMNIDEEVRELVRVQFQNIVATADGITSLDLNRPIVTLHFKIQET